MVFGQIDLERLIGNLGVPAAFMLAMAYMAIKYAPRVVAAHLDFIEAAKNQGQQCLKLQSRHAELLDAILDLVGEKMDPQGHMKFRDHLFSNVGTNRALSHFADVVEVLAKGSAHEDQIFPHLRAIRELLRDSPARNSPTGEAREIIRRAQSSPPGKK